MTAYICILLRLYGDAVVSSSVGAWCSGSLHGVIGLVSGFCTLFGFFRNWLRVMAGDGAGAGGRGGVHCSDCVGLGFLHLGLLHCVGLFHCLGRIEVCLFEPINILRLQCRRLTDDFDLFSFQQIVEGCLDGLGLRTGDLPHDTSVEAPRRARLFV